MRIGTGQLLHKQLLNNGVILAQAREHTLANEIDDINDSVGTPWPTPIYDRAGNTVSFPQPLALTTSFTAKYDAWNRLVKLTSGMTVVAEFA